ncbi:hypothetical protein F5890DRAFT_1559433 [Lentinula detonsa]|uniref:Uncharacterized protein n=1 Tax=Lentinula detonsa TaxID=2804962 RepID=A0AA38ULZ8_9AGAR|nr:hypothetical protein F5890DRAFT_1559433 [Lentinula detonsa]
MPQRTTRSQSAAQNAAMQRQTRSGQPLESYLTLSQVERDNCRGRKAKPTVAASKPAKLKARGRTVGKTSRKGKGKKTSKEESDVAQSSSDEDNDERVSPPPRRILHRSNATPVLSDADDAYESDTASRPPTRKAPMEVPKVIVHKIPAAVPFPDHPAKPHNEPSTLLSPRNQLTEKADPAGSPSIDAPPQEKREAVALHREIDMEFFSSAAHVDFEQAGTILESMNYSLFSLASVGLKDLAYVPSDQHQTAARSYAWKNVRSIYNKLRLVAHSEWTELIIAGDVNITFADSAFDSDNSGEDPWEELAALPATPHFSPRSLPDTSQGCPSKLEGEQAEETFSPTATALGGALVDYSSEAGTILQEEDEEEEDVSLTKGGRLHFTAEFQEEEEVEEADACSDNAGGMSGDEHECNTDQDDEDTSGSAPGRLSKQFKVRLNEIQERYRESVLEAAREEGKDLQVCWQYLEEGTRQPRSINRWNAFKAWWASNGDVQRAPDESLSTWNKFLKSKYLEVLKSRLSDDNLNDPEARSRAMKPEVDWYRDYVDSYFVAAKDTGHVRTSVKRIMRPLVNLAKKINDTSGYHILSFVITTATDRFGRSLSAFVAGDEVARLAKEAFESKIVDQIRDLEAYVRLTEINNRNVSMELSTLVAKFLRNIVNGRLEEKKDWEKRLLRLIFESLPGRGSSE